MDPSGNGDRFLYFVFGILVNSPIGQCFIIEELMVETFLLKDFHLDVVIPKPNISVVESVTRPGSDGYIGRSCQSSTVERMYLWPLRVSGKDPTKSMYTLLNSLPDTEVTDDVDACVFAILNILPLGKPDSS